MFTFKIIRKWKIIYLCLYLFSSFKVHGGEINHEVLIVANYLFPPAIGKSYEKESYADLIKILSERFECSVNHREKMNIHIAVPYHPSVDIQRELRGEASIGACKILDYMTEKNLLKIKNPNAKELVIIGHGWGGVAAISAAKILKESFNQEIHRLILIGSPKMYIGNKDVANKTNYIYDERDPFFCIGSWYSKLFPSSSTVVTSDEILSASPNSIKEIKLHNPECKETSPASFSFSLSSLLGGFSIAKSKENEYSVTGNLGCDSLGAENSEPFSISADSSEVSILGYPIPQSRFSLNSDLTKTKFFMALTPDKKTKIPCTPNFRDLDYFSPLSKDEHGEHNLSKTVDSFWSTLDIQPSKHSSLRKKNRIAKGINKIEKIEIKEVKVQFRKIDTKI